MLASIFKYAMFVLCSIGIFWIHFSTYKDERKSDEFKNSGEREDTVLRG